MHEIFVAWLDIVARWRYMVHGAMDDILGLVEGMGCCGGGEGRLTVA